MQKSTIFKHIKTNPHCFVYRLGQLGDLTLSTGVLKYWGERFNLRFTVLTKETFAPLFTGHPYVDKTISYPAQSLSLLDEISFFSQISKTYAGQLLIDLHKTPRSQVLQALWKGPATHYPKLSWERRLFLLSNKRLYKHKLAVSNVPQRYSLALCSDLPEATELKPVLYLSKEELTRAKERISELRLADRPVAIHPFASHLHKTWKKETWLKFLSLLKEHNIPFIVLGRGEKLLPNAPFDLIGQTSLRETAALLAVSQALITGDSGPMHIASAVQTPVIALFGPTTKEWGFFPIGKENIVIEPPVACRPCSLHGEKACFQKEACIEQISPQAVVQILLSHNVT